jgi:hypothetical protein
VQTPDELKTRTSEEAFNPNGLSQRTISKLKDTFPDLEVYTDVALDPYNSDGHDGIVRDDGVIMNDQTIEFLCRQAVSQVCPPPLLRAAMCARQPGDNDTTCSPLSSLTAHKQWTLGCQLVALHWYIHSTVACSSY